MWKVVAYYTRNTSYEIHAKKLENSLKILNIPFHIETINNLGDWYKNTQYKPTFLKQMLKKYYPDSIIYVDADALFCEYPKYFNQLDSEPAVNIAVHVLDHSKRRRKNHAPEMLSGTIFLKNTDITNQIVDKWIQKCKEGGHLWDQRALAAVLTGYKYHLLPEEYVTIFDYMADVRNPVIKHFQASREERRKLANQNKLKSNQRVRAISGTVRIKRTHSK